MRFYIPVVWTSQETFFFFVRLTYMAYEWKCDLTHRKNLQMPKKHHTHYIFIMIRTTCHDDNLVSYSVYTHAHACQHFLSLRFTYSTTTTTTTFISPLCKLPITATWASLPHLHTRDLLCNPECAGNVYGGSRGKKRFRLIADLSG